MLPGSLWRQDEIWCDSSLITSEKLFHCIARNLPILSSLTRFSRDLSCSLHLLEAVVVAVIGRAVSPFGISFRQVVDNEEIQQSRHLTRLSLQSFVRKADGG